MISDLPDYLTKIVAPDMIEIPKELNKDSFWIYQKM